MRVVIARLMLYTSATTLCIQIERATPLGRIDSAERGMPLRATTHEVVTEVDEVCPLLLGVLPPRGVDTVRDHHRFDVRQAVAQRRIDVIGQEPRPLHQMAVGIDDAPAPCVRHRARNLSRGPHGQQRIIHVPFGT